MPRGIFSVQERVLLVSCVYLCGNHHQVIAHEPELLKSVHEAGIRIPSIFFHKSGMTKELHNFISSSIQAGLCTQDIESMLFNLYSSHHSSRAYLYYSQATLSMDSYEQCNFLLFNPKRDSIGRMLITRAFLQALSECTWLAIVVIGCQQTTHLKYLLISVIGVTKSGSNCTMLCLL